MNMTNQVKRLRKLLEETFKDKSKEREELNRINKKLDVILKEIAVLKSKKSYLMPKEDTEKLKKIMWKQEFLNDFFVPDVEIEGMKVNAKVKIINSDKKDIDDNIGKLNLLKDKS